MAEPAGTSASKRAATMSVETRKLIGQAIIEGVLAPSHMIFAEPGPDYTQGKGDFTQTGGGTYVQGGGNYNQGKTTLDKLGDQVVLPQISGQIIRE